MEYQNSVVDEIERQETGAQRFTSRTGDYLSYRNGSRIVTVRPEHDGRVRVTTLIRYEEGNNGWCAARSYKSARGALRMIREHLHRVPTA